MLYTTINTEHWAANLDISQNNFTLKHQRRLEGVFPVAMALQHIITMGIQCIMNTLGPDVLIIKVSRFSTFGTISKCGLCRCLFHSVKQHEKYQCKGTSIDFSIGEVVLLPLYLFVGIH